ncbi:MAG: hypothetical protein R2867_04410 [Caldilineaceae bacterium]
MANERTYSMLPCRDIDEAIAFYAALGFQRTYRQLKPNPSAVVAYEEIQIHLFGMEGFNPADSYGSVIVVVPDPDALSTVCRGIARGVWEVARRRHSTPPAPAEKVRHRARLQRGRCGWQLAADL